MNKASGLAGQGAAAVQKITGRSVRYDPDTDTITVAIDNSQVAFETIEVDRMTAADLADIVARRWEEGTVIVARYLSPKHRKVLKDAGVNYVDTAGNAHLSAEGSLVLVEGQESDEAGRRVRIEGRAFQAAGLKVLLPLLVDPTRVNETYRELADRVSVSPTTVKHALDDLERRGHVIKVGRGRGMSRSLKGVVNLAQRWANAYGDYLRPKLTRGTYRFLDPQQGWEDVTPDAQTCWGGEPAADAYHGHLRPEVLTLYTSNDLSDVASALRIVPSANGSIEILDKFWTADVEVVDRQPIAPKILAYADLIASGATRNLEAAQSLFDSWKDVNVD